jgi:hypothetical protein
MKIRSALLPCLLEAGYYKIPPGMSIREVSKKWMAGEKAYDDSMPVWYAAEEVWPFREYTWSATNARNSPEEFETIRAKLKAEGWKPEMPAHVALGKDGKIKVGEGNHRLAIARELGLKVPVWFHFMY